MNLTQRQYTVGSSVAQGVIGAYNSALKIDGKWGSFTQAAYDRLNSDQKASVALAVSNVVPGSSPADYMSFRTQQKLDAARSVPNARSQSITQLIRTIAEQEGVPPEAAIKFATLESGLNPNAMNGSGATGLFQIMPVALADVNKTYGAKNGKQFTMSDMRDAALNARVGAQYMKIAARYANVPLSDVATVYMAYNIGAGNLAKLRAGKFDDPVAKRAVMNQNAAYGRDPRTYIAKVTSIIDNMQVA